MYGQFIVSECGSVHRMLGVKSCMSGHSYSNCRQCRNATVTVANNSGLLSHARSLSVLLTAFGVSRSLSTLAVVSMYYIRFFEQMFSMREA